MSLRVSVALCTFNGAPFLQPQLDSLLAQSRLPDELVACDDGSGDTTIALLEDLSHRSPFPVRIVRNRVRLGIGGNFAQAVSLCGGDVVALADQDDVWHPAKLQRLAAALAAPAVVAAFSDALIADEQARPAGGSMWRNVRFDRCEQARLAAGDALGVLLKHYVVTGATLAFRTDLRPLVLPIPHGWAHDAWIAAVAAASGRVVPLAEPLMYYRQHGGNATGAATPRLLLQWQQGLEQGRGGYLAGEIGRFQALADRLRGGGLDAAADLVEAKLAYLRRRAAFPSSRVMRLPAVFAEWARGEYRRYATDWKSVAVDLFFP